MATPFEIAGRPIGPAEPPYLIAELSGNHNGEKKRALDLIDAAVSSGAHAVKLQTYTADTITLDHTGAEFSIEQGPWKGRSLHDLYDEAHTPWEWHAELFARGKKSDITIFSSPFDSTAVDLLEELGCPAYKIASFELVDTPLIRRAAAAGKPMIISTGLATLPEIREAVEAAREGGAREIALLHCVSAYPAPAREANLSAIHALRNEFDVQVGLSDHTLGTSVAVAAVALGATLIEKHMTIARADGGPDAQFSLEPDEFAELSQGTLTAWEALGDGRVGVSESEASNLMFRRSLYVVEDMEADEPFTIENVRSIRPGHGLPPKNLARVLGKSSSRVIRRGTPLSWDLIAEHPTGSID